MDKQDETNHGIVIKEEFIIEDVPILPKDDGEIGAMFIKKEEIEDEPTHSKDKLDINEIVVKKEEELIIEDELDLAKEDEITDDDSLQSNENDANLTCSICQETFEKACGLARHVKSHKQISKKSNEFHCEFCGKVFYAKPLYSKHLKRHRPRIFKCDLCPKAYPEKFNLNSHLKVKHGIQTTNSASNSPTVEMDPATEDFAFDDENDKLTSTSTGGKKDPSLYCEKCDKTFKVKRYCDTHKRKHLSLEKGLYRCVPCKKSFVEKYTLELHEKSLSHRRKTEPAVDVQFYCTACDKVFHSKVRFSQHMRLHRPRDFPCHLCPKSFSENFILTRHLRNVHLVLGPAERVSKVYSGSPDNQKENESGKPGCSSLNDEDEDFLQEMPQVASKNEAEQCCETCNKVFKYKKSYESHMQRHALSTKIKY